MRILARHTPEEARHHPRSQQVQPVEEGGDLLGVHKVIDGVPTRFQCATASSMAAPWTALVEWLIVRRLPGASAATRRRTIEYACPVPGMWCTTPGSISATGWVKSAIRDCGATRWATWWVLSAVGVICRLRSWNGADPRGARPLCGGGRTRVVRAGGDCSRGSGRLLFQPASLRARRYCRW